MLLKFLLLLLTTNATSNDDNNNNNNNNTDHLKVHLTSETRKKKERNWTKKSDGAERRWSK